MEAVKDVATELKTTGSATFGKPLKTLLDEVTDQLGDIEQQFSKIDQT